MFIKLKDNLFLKVGHRRNEQMKELEIPKSAIYVLLVLTVGFLLYQISPTIMTSNLIAASSNPSASKIDFNSLIEQVTPKEGMQINATWGNVVQDMEKAGILDVSKLKNILQNSYGQQLTPDEERILNTPNLNDKPEINNDNAVFMMYVLWALGKDNKNPVLDNSPFAKYFNNYDIGVGKAGYSDVILISLSSDQQALLQDVSQNSYRPCCSNPTAWPDCSHGFALLGLQELMASQGFGKDDIYKASLAFNSYWFPANYVYDAAYFKLTQNKNWSQIDSSVLMSRDYSSLTGAIKIQSYLKSSGVI